MPSGLNHIAMSVPKGTLSDDYRAEVVRFYGELLGWDEIDSLRLPDRMTLAVGRHTYINLRERDDVMQTTGYEHFGIVVDSSAAAEEAWEQLGAQPHDVELSELASGVDGYRSFRFRYLLPLTVEIQYFP
jgi:hypothetical protein